MKANLQIAPANLKDALKVLSAVANLCFDSDHGGSPPALPAQEYPPEEYLTVRQVAARIKYGEQSVRNMMTAGVFRRGVHYYKRRGRVLFLWSRMEQWLREDTAGPAEPMDALPQLVWPDQGDKPFYPVHRARSRKTREAIL